MRRLLIHGARSVLRHSAGRTDTLSERARGLQERRHANVVAVALAAKNAHIAWAVLTKGSPYEVREAAEAGHATAA